MMVVTNPDEFFYAANGAVLKSLEELADFMKECDDGTFNHHVNNERNDFANWVQDILKKKMLSKKLLKSKSKEEMTKALFEKAKKKKTTKQKKTIISQIKDAVLYGK